MKNACRWAIALGIFAIMNLPARAVMEDFTSGIAGQTLDTDGWLADGYNSPADWVFDHAGREFVLAANNLAPAYVKKPFANPLTDSAQDVYLRTVIKVRTASIFAGVRNTDISHAVMVNLYYGNPKGVRVYNASGVLFTEDSGYLIQSNHTYEAVIQMKNVDYGNCASVYIRDLTAGENDYTLLSFAGAGSVRQTTIPMGFTETEKPATFCYWHLRSFGSGYVDEIELDGGIGTAITIEPTVPCADAWANGYGMPEDLNQDCYINSLDLAEMAAAWLVCNGPAGGVVETDFSTGTAGAPLPSDGWTTDGYGDAADWVFDMAGGEFTMAAKNTAPAYARKSFANPVTDSDEDVYLRSVIKVGAASIFVGLRNTDISHAVMVNLYYGTWHGVRVYNAAGKVYLEDSGYTIQPNHTYETVIQMKNADYGNSALVYIKDITAGDAVYTQLSFTVGVESLQATIPMGFSTTERPATFSSWHLRGFGSGHVDEIALGIGTGTFGAPAGPCEDGDQSGDGDLPEDLSGDCCVNLYDLAQLAAVWLSCNDPDNAACESEVPDEFYVSLDGDDSNPGTISEPFRTLEKARDTIMNLAGLSNAGITVYIRGGKYFRPGSPFELGVQDSGRAGKRVIYRGYPGETVRVVGGVELDSSWFAPTSSSSPVWNRLDAGAQGNVLKCDLGSHGIVDWGEVRNRGYQDTSAVPAHLELSFNAEMMQLARWPNVGFDTTEAFEISDTVFGYVGTRPHRWLSATNPVAFGYWEWDWSPQYIKINDIDTANKRITLDRVPYYGIGKRQRWYALNLIEELDMPGEYYVDGDSGILYFWPPSDINAAEIMVSMLGENNEPIVKMINADHVTFRDLTFELCRDNAFSINTCEHVLIDRCVVRNTGNMAFDVNFGQDVDVQNCDVYGIGGTAFDLSGGDPLTLTSSGFTVQNNKIHDFSRWYRAYEPGVYLHGCGHEVLNNYFHDAPHSAIMALGWQEVGNNSHVMRFNEFENICYETDDAGVVMLAQDWGYRGNKFENNFMHDICTNAPPYVGVIGVYLDSAVSSLDMFGNVFYDIEGRGILVNGGRDNHIDNNVIVKTSKAINASRAGIIVINQIPGDFSNYREKIESYNYDQPPWSIAYPELAAIFDQGYDMALEPQGNTIVNNIGWGNTIWQYDTGYGAYGAFDFFADISGNREDSDPKFVDEVGLNLALRDDSPAYLISGFERIPFERIGMLDPCKATRPNPADGTYDVSITPTLYWAQALHATARNVYLGRTYAEVDAATPASAAFQGTIVDYEYSPENLSPGTTYYWRIDEIGVDGDACRGDVWTFVTADTTREDFTFGLPGEPLSIGGWVVDGYGAAGDWVFDTAEDEFDLAAKNVAPAYVRKAFVSPITDSDADVYLRCIIKVGTSSIFAGVRDTDISHAVMVNLYHGASHMVRVYNASGIVFAEDSGYTIQSNHTYETLLQMKNVDHGNAASVYIKDLTAGGIDFTLLTFTVEGVAGQTTIPMGFTETEKPATFRYWHLRSFGSGHVDEMTFGVD